jgi:hypothetical protein
MTDPHTGKSPMTDPEHFTITRSETGELVFTPPTERAAALRFLGALLQAVEATLEPAALPKWAAELVGTSVLTVRMLSDLAQEAAE